MKLLFLAYMVKGMTTKMYNATFHFFFGDPRMKLKLNLEVVFVK